ncbi:MAG: membrane protein insertion efficiency factor YidD [Deferribacteraceae bacterium]|nr:membrane protein insertion efficiency factor YidD [Deferribacteraceae bacterium]
MRLSVLMNWRKIIIYSFIASAPQKAAIVLIKLYKRALSPYFGNQCRFYPTCSTYALEAFQQRGFCKGLLLTLWRILRCNPFNQGGYDPLEPPKP